MQDTSVTEYGIIKNLAAGHKNLAFFGDVDQTIYEWRDSKPYEILKAFRKDFDPQEIMFANNYRSTAILIKTADALLSGYDKRQSATPKCETKTEGEKIKLICGRTLAAEIKRRRGRSRNWYRKKRRGIRTSQF